MWYTAVIMVCFLIGLFFIKLGLLGEPGEEGRKQVFIIAIVFFAITIIMIVMCAIPVQTELASEEIIYSSPLVSVNDISKEGVVLPDNIYVIETNNGEYIFYTLGYMGEKIKKNIAKEDVIFEAKNDVLPFVEAYKQTYISKNIFGDERVENIFDKYYLTIPENGIVSNSLLDLV